ncbi:MAG: hypothetical protein M1813_006347 [Trichoglossum hirsutum]|nr:MAG: hypothetical protein M1813_006347 [Trichoglossum hirsutum]
MTDNQQSDNTPAWRTAAVVPGIKAGFPREYDDGTSVYYEKAGIFGLQGPCEVISGSKVESRWVYRLKDKATGEIASGIKETVMSQA